MMQLQGQCGHPAFCRRSAAQSEPAGCRVDDRQPGTACSSAANAVADQSMYHSAGQVRWLAGGAGLFEVDGRSLYPRQVFFPMANAKEGWAKLAQNLKAEIDETRITAYQSTQSLPFELGEHGRAAVKIVDDRGIESLKRASLKPHRWRGLDHGWPTKSGLQA